ncbi:hypothetical protein BDY21DRAFT_219578 [Lineolata rhizophorae]|uniref:Uncharacterized protein n=1 Tax=Lineolata rhizophorae TaxID=578093 RepID=A0A6A6P354_9PEZI|nr:hypothetical protein BDY21DRAFT_219578 [Lineolata rhizophorae]
MHLVFTPPRRHRHSARLSRSSSLLKAAWCTRRRTTRTAIYSSMWTSVRAGIGPLRSHNSVQHPSRLSSVTTFQLRRSCSYSKRSQAPGTGIGGTARAHVLRVDEVVPAVRVLGAKSPQCGNNARLFVASYRKRRPMVPLLYGDDFGRPFFV